MSDVASALADNGSETFLRVCDACGQRFGPFADPVRAAIAGARHEREVHRSHYGASGSWLARSRRVRRATAQPTGAA